MQIGVLKEPEYENRVSVLPDIVAQLLKLKVEVKIETGAGIKASAADSAYEAVGAKIATRADVLSTSNILLGIHNIGEGEFVSMKHGTILTGVYQPLFNVDTMGKYAAANFTVFSLDMLPRTTRAQAMDVLSSQANIAGYKAVVLAASVYPHYFPMLTTAAGSIPPAKVLILGAGVAGLQAIATAKRLGAVVEVFDTRAAAKEEVMSLGAKFVEVEGAADASKAGGYAVTQTEEYQQRQKARIAQAIAKADVVISTAQIPGKKAPVLITGEMVTAMKPGSVIIDLAAATGGNCELTENNATVVKHSVTIIGQSNLAGTVPVDASRMYGKNILNFLKLIIDDKGGLNLNFEDDLVLGACITDNGKVVHERLKGLATSN